jgi:hypothetical protein
MAHNTDYGLGGGGGQGGGLLQNPLFVNPVAAAAGGFAGGIADLFRGPSQGEQDLEKVFGLLQNRLGQSVLDPSQFLAQYMQSLAPQFNKQAAAIDVRLGLDSGAAQGELARGQQGILARILADLNVKNQIATSQQDLSVLAQLGDNARARI